MSTVDGPKVLADAQSYLRTVVAGVAEERWGDPTPCTEWTVRQVLNHARLDQLAYAAAITGEKGMPPSDPFQPVDAFEGSPLVELDDALARTAAAWATVPPDAETAPTPIFLMPAWLGAGACALDAGVHAWDIAVATGQGLPLPEELAEPLTAVAHRIVEGLREYGVFAPVLPAPPGETGRAAALLRFLGRDPHWSHPA